MEIFWGCDEKEQSKIICEWYIKNYVVGYDLN